MGLNTIAAAISEEKDAIEDIYEPFLIQIGFLDRTPRGRVATARAYEYFGLKAPGPGTPALVDRATKEESVPQRDARTLIPDHRPAGLGCGRPTEISALATYVPPAAR